MDNSISSAKSAVSFYRLGLLGLVTLMVCLLGTSTEARPASSDGGYTQGGGYAGPGPAVVSVEQAKGMRDDSWIALRGYIVQRLGDDEYLFRDASGDITVEIKDRHWQGQNVGPADLVEISGKLDKDWMNVEVEVKRLVKLPAIAPAQPVTPPGTQQGAQ